MQTQRSVIVAVWMQDNIYLELTRVFNAGRLRAILSSGQAVVMHRLAVMSKDGDWILREDEETLQHVLGVLEARGAHYRFGAPLAVCWMAGGWSSHFEFRTPSLRVRTDFVTRPPRTTPEALATVWANAEERRQPVPFVDAATLAELKKTNREKDYAVLGELARVLKDPEQQILLSRSGRDLVALAGDYPGLMDELAVRRPLLRHVRGELGILEAALDAERRQLMHANELRLQSYTDAALPWSDAWPQIAAETAGLPLQQAHRLVTERARGLLPAAVEIPES